MVIIVVVIMVITVIVVMIMTEVNGDNGCGYGNEIMVMII